MTENEIYQKLAKEFGDKIIEFKDDKNFDPFIKVQPDAIVDICLYLRDDNELLFDYLVNLTGMDYGKDLGVVYHFYSMKYNHRFVVKVDLPRDNAKLETVEKVWQTANWHEREAFDMFGIEFENHPYMRRILTPEDWVGNPLRKDYKPEEFYHGIKIAY